MKKIIQKSYYWHKDKKIIGTIVLFIAIAFQIFAFLKIPFLSSIHGYTIGMIIGFYNPLFYLLVSYIALKTIFYDKKIHMPKWIKLNISTYLMIALSIIFIGVSTSYYQEKIGYISIGKSSWNSFNIWFNQFIDSKNAWVPNNTNGGVLGAFIYSFFAMMFSGIGALIISILMIFIVLSYIATRTSVGFYKQSKLQNKNIDNDLKNKVNEKNTKNIFKNKKIEKKDNNEKIMPFDDPF